MTSEKQTRMPLSTRVLKLLRRDTGSAPYFAEIDSLRFVAIAMVVIFHLVPTWGPSYAQELLRDSSAPYSHLNRGVQLFFVISGFILVIPFARHSMLGGKAVGIKKYFLRRLTRLEPPYILSLLLCSLGMIIFHQWTHDMIVHLLTAMFYVHTLVLASKTAINPVAWSLEIEIQFYILVPLLACIFELRNPVVRRAAIVLPMILLITLSGLFDTYRIYHSILGQGQYFLGGFLLADFYLTRTERRSWIWDVVGTVAFVLMLTGKQFVWHWFLPFGVLLFFWSALSGTILNYLFRNPWTSAIGGMCYSIYLTHVQLMTFTRVVLAKRFKIDSPLAVNAASLFMIAVFSTAYFLLIEKPCMRHDWPQALWKRLHEFSIPGKKQTDRRENALQEKELSEPEQVS